jgi:hypothetical protein
MNIENSLETETISDSANSEMFQWVSKNIYFVVLSGIVFVYLFYKYLVLDFDLEEVKKGLNIDTNIIGNINHYLSKLWLSAKVDGNTIQVTTKEKEGLLDRVVEGME